MWLLAGAARSQLYITADLDHDASNLTNESVNQLSIDPVCTKARKKSSTSAEPPFIPNYLKLDISKTGGP